MAEKFEVCALLTVIKAETQQLVVDRLREKGCLAEFPSPEGAAAKADMGTSGKEPTDKTSPTKPPIMHGVSAEELQLTLDTGDEGL